MRAITSLDKANSYLERFHDHSRTVYTLDNMLQLMDFLDNPQEKFKTIHVAGTSGKTSTAYFAASLLSRTGAKVGLTVSPHVTGLNERVQINTVPLPEAEFVRALTGFLKLIEKVPVQPSWFEVMVSFAYWYFAKVRVDYVVAEVGLGGLKDGTNVINRPDKVAVITDIGLDHLNVLGRTLGQIAEQKIGIVHAGNQVFTYRQAPEIMAVFEAWIKSHHATLEVIDEAAETTKLDIDFNDMPEYQKRNWLLAHRVYEHIANRDNLQHLTSQVLQETQKLVIPGRMDIRHLNGKTIIMDGAHNAQKMKAFVTSFQQLYPGAKPVVLVALKEGKEYKGLVPLLKALASQVVVTKFVGAQDLPFESMDPAELAGIFKKAGLNAVSEPDQTRALDRVLHSDAEVIVITGSFYLLSQIRNNELLR